MDSSRPDRTPDDDAHGRRLFERALPDLIRKVIEAGVGKLAEGPEGLRSFVADLKLPKEIANYLLVQIEETKHGLERAVAKEIRGYLDHHDFGDEMAKALSKVSLEIKTEIRFMPKADERPVADASLESSKGPQR